MTEENIADVTVQHKLRGLRDEIMEFAKSANNCSIIMTNHHSQNVGETIGLLGNGMLIKDKTQRKEYNVLVETYNQFAGKLLLCDCKLK